MRLFLLAFLFPLISLAGNGEPVFPAPGSYTFQQRFELLQKKRFEIIYSFTDSGMDRMHELQEAGYICTSATRDTFLCSNFQSLAGEHPDLSERLQKQLNGVALVFGEVRGPAELLRKSSQSVEWTMPQAVDFKGKHYDSFRFILSPSAGGLQRISLGEPTDDTFVLSDNGDIGYTLVVSISESRSVFRRYLGLAGFSK
jgi:hypothetical protein